MRGLDAGVWTFLALLEDKDTRDTKARSLEIAKTLRIKISNGVKLYKL
jgi:hypothetical protein